MVNSAIFCGGAKHDISVNKGYGYIWGREVLGSQRRQLLGINTLKRGYHGDDGSAVSRGRVSAPT